MNAIFRPFDAEIDVADVARIWHETRWIDADNDGHRRALEAFLGGGSAEVGVIDGAAECLVHRTLGTIDYDHSTLPASVISAVTTSHVGRRQRLASTLTARALAHAAADGAAVALLGMFEQGFYDRFGFATGAPTIIATFDPDSLRVDHVPYRPPVRLGLDDSVAMGEAMRRRLAHHGRVTLDAVDIMAAEWGFLEQPFALGYRDGDRITHFVAGSLKEENGPFEIQFCSYETGEQLLELLRLLHELGDQVHSVELVEPAHIQLHPLLDSPNRQRSRSRRGAHETATRAATWWQFRVLDVPTVVGARHWIGPPVEFDMVVTDPVEDMLTAPLPRATDDASWSGTAGTYRIRVGATSTGERLTEAEAGAGDRPVMRCSIGSFSRLWFGVQPATSLALTAEIDAPATLLDELDAALLLPRPQPGQFF
jgi:predicted acetyltransferase